MYFEETLKKPSKSNCRDKNECPLNGNCLEENIIYKGINTCEQPGYKEKAYLGSARTTFKLRYGNHLKSFENKKYENNTELSKEVWKIKPRNYTPKIYWSIIRKCLTFSLDTKKCQLCRNEKLEIALHQGENLLNKKSEVIRKCRRQNKFLLLHHDTRD